MIYSKQQLLLFDKILKYYIEYYIIRTERRNPNSILFSKIFNIDIELSQYSINEACKNGVELGLLNAEKLGYGDYEVVKVHKIPIENFINHGGFEKHFEESILPTKADKTLVINIGTLFNKIASNNWTITIIGGLIVGLIILYLSKHGVKN
jgi:hypothetical protein